MNNKYKANTNSNKVKQCGCENKVGPKPFNVPNTNLNPNSIKSK